MFASIRCQIAKIINFESKFEQLVSKIDFAVDGIKVHNSQFSLKVWLMSMAIKKNKQKSNLFFSLH